MGATYTCECGWRWRGETDEELISAVDRHLSDAHPQVAGALGRAGILAIAEEEDR